MFCNINIVVDAPNLLVAIKFWFINSFIPSAIPIYINKRCAKISRPFSIIYITSCPSCIFFIYFIQTIFCIRSSFARSNIIICSCIKSCKKWTRLKLWSVIHIRHTNYFRWTMNTSQPNTSCKDRFFSTSFWPFQTRATCSAIIAIRSFGRNITV